MKKMVGGKITSSMLLLVSGMALLLLSLSTACSVRSDEREEPTPLTASGTIRASEVRIASEMGGRIGEVLVRTGDQVEAGDVVVSMDVTPLLLQLGPAEAAVETARADLALVRAGPRPEEVEASRAALTLAEAQRDGARAAWENALEAVENPQDLNAQIIEARTQVALAAQGVEKAESDLEAARAVRDRNFGSYEAEQRVKAAEAALSAAQADQATAQTALSHLLRIRQEPLGFIAQAHVAEGQYRVAEEEVAVARARLDDLLAGPLPEEVAVAEAQVQQAEAEADVLRVQVAKGSLITPIDGVVLEVVLRSGEIAAPAATILTLADVSQVTLEVYVPEDRIGWVQLGQPVDVQVDSFPDLIFEGHVIRVGSEPEYTPQNVATEEERRNTFYVVEIRLPNPEGRLKAGMPADATFQ